MRIGYVRLDYGEWQSDTYNVQEIGLAKAFEALGHQTTIVYWLSTKDCRCGTEVELSPNVKKVYLPYTLRVGHHAWPKFYLLEKLGIDVFHIQSDNLLYVPEAVDYCIRHRLKHYCYVGTIQSSAPKLWKRWVMDKLMGRNIAAFRRTMVFCKTPAVVHELLDKGVKEVRWAPVGLDTDIIPQTEKSKDELRLELGLPTDKVLVLLVSALREDKRPMDIFPLAEMLGENFQLIHIGLPGTQAEEYQAKLASDLKYRNIAYLGKMPNQRIHDYYVAADYVVNFNPNEIFGMAILEAMFHNITVVARHAPGPDCIIEHGRSGFLCGTVEGMAETIKSGAKAAGAYERIMQQFTWKSTAEKFIAAVQSM